MAWVGQASARCPIHPTAYSHPLLLSDASDQLHCILNSCCYSQIFTGWQYCYVFECSDRQSPVEVNACCYAPLFTLSQHSYVCDCHCVWDGCEAITAPVFTKKFLGQCHYLCLDLCVPHTPDPLHFLMHSAYLMQSTSQLYQIRPLGCLSITHLYSVETA